MMDETHNPPTRREFLTGAAAGTGLLLTQPLVGEAQTPVKQAGTATAAPVTNAVTLNLNGVDKNLQLDSRVTLLDALREYAHMTGSKKGCDHGQCGACTVHIDGRRINSCLTFAWMHRGQKITTIEGLANGDKLHPMQTAFIQHDGYQCGYCTPGQIMSAVAVVQEGHAHTEDEIREQMSGNLCRCGAYPNIVNAVQSVMNGPSATSTQTGSRQPDSGTYASQEAAHVSL